MSRKREEVCSHLSATLVKKQTNKMELYALEVFWQCLQLLGFSLKYINSKQSRYAITWANPWAEIIDSTSFISNSHFCCIGSLHHWLLWHSHPRQHACPILSFGFWSKVWSTIEALVSEYYINQILKVIFHMTFKKSFDKANDISKYTKGYFAVEKKNT